MLLNCGVGENSWESLGLQGDPTVHPKEDQSWVFTGRTDVEAETPILWLPDAKSWLIWKDPDAGKDWGQEEKGTTEDERVGWHQWLSGHEFGWTPGVDDRQGSLACYGSWGRKSRTRLSDWTELIGLREEGCRDKMLLPQHCCKSRHYQHNLTTVDVNFDHLLCKCLSGFSTVKLFFFPPFHTVIFGKKSVCSPHLKSEWSYSTSLGAGYLHKLFGILLILKFVCSPLLTYFFNDLFIVLWTHGYWLYTWFII